MRVLVGVMFCALLAGCSVFTFGDDPVEVPLAEAEAFGRIDVPNGVAVLKVRRTHFQDTLYAVVLRATARDVDMMLRNSKFTEPFRPVQNPATLTVIAGPPLSGATNVKEAQDHVEKPWVYRTIVQDVRSPDEVYLHISLFNT
ncbi:Uncharacterised protein [Mycolicibacterium phlei]|uniref:hypothetical protein n=1 Tax=Mycobacteroides chelonae TaxID=1774 RepID=UPI000618C64B|nr:hypothetical protein [Mycobacteroides chelonae]VEG14640.1 Uncharacterised protein [Mycolicibacterium phlei]AKC37660.1 hypothetical protein GR01_02460 [Mycobacteroides chelonae]ANA96733.1 hypothetical protein BB28_02505 [Mycobacteroides chelonae CCUG 47445]OLT81151.1 hypothetical protein BKG56_02515 [Mycobacteroides chelonae]ORV17775.1 hypothetical protein AWB96_02800 [Mycobacteroides chelonae]